MKAFLQTQIYKMYKSKALRVEVGRTRSYLLSTPGIYIFYSSFKCFQFAAKLWATVLERFSNFNTSQITLGFC